MNCFTPRRARARAGCGPVVEGVPARIRQESLGRVCRLSQLATTCPASHRGGEAWEELVYRAWLEFGETRETFEETFPRFAE